MEGLIVKKENEVLYLTLNRPELRNALNFQLMKNLSKILREIEDDIKVVVINSSSDKAFCSGIDLKELKEFIENKREREFFASYAELIFSIEECKAIVVSVVKGYALAGGCGLAITCDITIASEDSKFGVPEINLNMWPSIISYPILKVVNPKKAMELFLTGRIIDASEAEKLGMVNFVVEKDSLDEFVANFVKSLTEKSSLTLRVGKESFKFVTNDGIHKIRYLKEMSAFLSSSNYEKIKNFLEKSRK